MYAHRNRGLTLVELLTVICIGWLLTQSCVWGLSRLLDKTDRQLALQATIGALDRARSLSVIRGKRVAVCMFSAGQACSADWSGGDLAVFVDDNKNRQRDAGEEIVYQQVWPSRKIRPLWSNWRREPTITYQPDGSVVSNGTLYFQEPGGYSAQALVISKPGRARIQFN
jgi:type IV fimbrial biogenesis protein FimT